MDIEKNYALFKKYIKVYVGDESVPLLEWLDTTDMKTAPASTKYHNCVEGGLVAHSLNVFNNLMKLMQGLYGNDFEGCPYSKATLAKVSLLHDISKADLYMTTYRNVKDENDKWHKVSGYAVKEESERLLYGNNGMNSVYLIKQYLTLTYDEEIAILYHRGHNATDGFVDEKRVMSVFKKIPLAFWLYVADMKAICCDEVMSNE
jgi:hypothetical protein